MFTIVIIRGLERWYNLYTWRNARNDKNNSKSLNSSNNLFLSL